MDESPAIGERSDAELLSAVRAGDDDAFARLWSRHELAARRLAGQIAPSSNVDDLISESFYRVLRTIKAGGGPQDAFRPYLFSTMRRFNIDTGRSYHQRVTLTGEAADLDVDHSESAADVAAISTEQRAAWLAWASLPDASRALLWHLVIEEETPAQIAPILGTSPNGVASRAVRAKERLRQAFLQQQLAAADTEQCREARNHFGAYVRDALSARDRAAVETHLDGCDRCRAALAEISDVNKTLRVVIAPIILGGATIASRYLVVTAAAHGAAAVGAAATHGGGAAATRALRASAHGAHAKSGSKFPGIAAGVVVGVIIAAALAAWAAMSGSHSSQRPLAVPVVGTGAATAPLLPPAVPPSSTQPATPPVGTTPPAVTTPPVVTTPPAGTTPPAAPPAAAGPALAAVPSPTSPIATSPARGYPPVAPGGTPASSAQTSPSTPAPTSAIPPPPVRTETVGFSVPGPVGLVRLSVPDGWTIDSVDVHGLGRCSPAGGQTVRCVFASLRQDYPMSVRVTGQGPRAMLHVVSAGVRGQVQDYPL